MIGYDTIHFNSFRSTLIIVKTNLYVMFYENIFIIPLNQMTGYRGIYSNKCLGIFCYIFMGCINSNKEMYYYFYNNSLGTNETNIANIPFINF